MERKAALERNTNETRIKAEINIDGTGSGEIKTGIGFFDHMLGQISRHGFFDLTLQANGDLEVDCHHTIEDVGIVLGKCVSAALGDKSGIRRYGDIILPMEDALIICAIDISGRPYLGFDVNFTCERLGDMDTEMVVEFFRAFCLHSGINMHIKMLSGSNNHHICEGIFKAFAKALDEATSIDSRISGVLSTKGMLEV